MNRIDTDPMALPSDSPPHAAPPAITPLLRTVLLCDLVNSTALVERVGDARMALLWQRLDQMLQRELARHQGQLIDKADGVLALFERPVQALAFALAYQQGLHALDGEFGEALRARVGIHVGEVMTWTHSREEVLAGAKPVEVEGLAKPVAARLMALALPGQILLSGMAQNLAQRAQGELGEQGKALRWQLHGRYRFKGVPAPMLVHEAGLVGLSPLKPPTSGDKAWRELPVWRKPPVLALELLVVVGLATAGLWSVLKSPPAIAFNERDWVVVADFNNLTGETLYDDALDSALRIGLEQSRYVNVLSDLQVDQALQRMQRDEPRLDRQSGSELALREGAKALVLPTVADVGGRPRVTVEVVDPASGVTVYTHMADASGSGSGGVVAALDDVLVEMRADLGESLASIQKSSVPLEKATTSDLQALRALATGIKAYYQDRIPEASALFFEAIERDPSFAMAYLRLGTLNYGSHRLDEAQRFLAIAASHRDRLTQREALLLDATLGVFETPQEMLNRWRTLASLYPDEFRAYYNFAGFGRRDAQEYASAAEFLMPALSSRFVGQASAYYELGQLNLILDRLDDALKSFQHSESLGLGGRKGSFADAFAARREFQKANQVLESQNVTGEQAWLLEERQGEISYPLDQGNWQAASSATDKLSILLEGAPLMVLEGLELQRLTLRAYAPDAAFSKDLNDYIGRLTRQLDKANRLDRRHLVFRLLAAGWMAAQSGEIALANSVLKLTNALSERDDYPANADMLLVVRAELLLAGGRPEAAIVLLAERADAGEELYFIHAALMRAYAAAQRFEQALAQADWLATHRGRAYGEPNSEGAWQPANLIESNLALLAAASYAVRLGRITQSTEFDKSFDLAWPEGRHLPATLRRQSML